MALQILKGYKEIDGEKILQERITDSEGVIDWKATDEARKNCPIFIDHDVNMISFRLQNGPIKEVGKNGCQVTALVAAACEIVRRLNATHPCEENAKTIACLMEAQTWQRQRTKNREARGVEGTSNV